MLSEQRLERQNMLLASARMHNEYGDLDRSVQAYHDLTAMEGSEAVAEILADEIAVVEKHWDSVQKARSLALADDHESARAALEEGCSDLREHLMPWRIESHPSGARTRLPDGWERVTPFTAESAFGEPLELTFHLEGHEPRTLRVDSPSNQFLTMSRLADLWWRNDSPITALPVPVDGDYLCADRSGRVVRLSEEGTRWTVKLNTIGGIARTPTMLPKRPGTVLMLSEEGNAWFVHSGTGQTEGPFSLRSPPASGPVATATGVSAGFMSGATALWEQELEPTVTNLKAVDDDEFYDENRKAPQIERDSHGADGGLAVLRRSAREGIELASPWKSWGVRVNDDAFEVTSGDDSERSFTVSRDGDWHYLAWEAPSRGLPEGRLWVSDANGLRAFKP